MVARDELQPGDMFVGHRISRRIGAGGWGVVYQAYDLVLRRDVAFKVIAVDGPVDDHYGELFQREWCLLAEAEHPNVLPIFRAGVESGHPYLVTRLVRGGSLRGLLGSGTRLAASRALHLLAQVASALDHVHARGIVHRDVKPENILIEGMSGAEHAWLADFGLARYFDADRHVVIGGSGTSPYMAPEQRDGGPGAEPRTDVFALALVLYEVLAGHRLPLADHDPLRLPRDAGPLIRDLSPVFRRALATRPEDRYASAGELVDAARGVLALAEPSPWTATTDASARHLLPAPDARRPPRRRRASRLRAGPWPVAAAVALAAALGAGGYQVAESTGWMRDAAGTAPLSTTVAAPSSTAPLATSRPPASSAPPATSQPPPATSSPPPPPSVTPASSVAPPQVPRPERLTVCGETVTVRADPEPLAETRVVANLEYGDTFDVERRQGSAWVYGSAPNGVAGWVLRQWLAPTCPDPSPAAGG